MKASDRAVLLALLVAGLGAAFWFLALSPKRQEATELETQISALQDEVAQQETVVAAARLAQEQYEDNYSTLVTLGKAAPADGDTPALLEQLTTLSERAGTTFENLVVGTAVELPTAPAPAPTPAPEASEASTPPGEAAAATPPVAATPSEATAASLPLGATVGPAGLGILPYDITFSGNFFEIADLMKSVDRLVDSKPATVDVSGRLLTVNSFTMETVDEKNTLEVTLSATAYVLPESQGLTAGATSAAPPTTVPAAVPTPGGDQ